MEIQFKEVFMLQIDLGIISEEEEDSEEEVDHVSSIELEGLQMKAVEQKEKKREPEMNEVSEDVGVDLEVVFLVAVSEEDLRSR